MSLCQGLFVTNSSAPVRRSVGIVAIVALSCRRSCCGCCVTMLIVGAVTAVVVVVAVVVIVMMAKSKDYFESSALWRIFYFFCDGFNLGRVSFCSLMGELYTPQDYCPFGISASLSFKLP